PRQVRHAEPAAAQADVREARRLGGRERHLLALLLRQHLRHARSRHPLAAEGAHPPRGGGTPGTPARVTFASVIDQPAGPRACPERRARAARIARTRLRLCRSLPAFGYEYRSTTAQGSRSAEHTSALQSRVDLVCRPLL